MTFLCSFYSQNWWKFSLMTVFNTISWRFLIVAYFFLGHPVYYKDMWRCRCCHGYRDVQFYLGRWCCRVSADRRTDSTNSLKHSLRKFPCVFLQGAPKKHRTLGFHRRFTNVFYSPFKWQHNDFSRPFYFVCYCASVYMTFRVLIFLAFLFILRS